MRSIALLPCFSEKMCDEHVLDDSLGHMNIT